MKTSRLQIGPTATDCLSSMLNVFANFFCKIFMFLLLHLLHIKPWPGLVFEEAKATSGQAKAGAFRPSRAGTALLLVLTVTLVSFEHSTNKLAFLEGCRGLVSDILQNMG